MIYLISFFSETKIFPGIVPNNNTEKKASCKSSSISNGNSTALPFYRLISVYTSRYGPNMNPLSLTVKYRFYFRTREAKV